jgi:hypothetical protein
MFSRKTSAPASMSRLRISELSLAGPKVQMIFVFRIPLSHDSNPPRKSKPFFKQAQRPRPEGIHPLGVNRTRIRHVS